MKNLIKFSIFCSLLAPSTLLAEEGVGTFGLSEYGGIHAVVGVGERSGESGQQYSIHAEGGYLDMPTPLGNIGGIEGGAILGYDGIPMPEEEAVLPGMMFDMWLGFPITVFYLGENQTSAYFRANIGVGMGTSLVSAYTFLKARLAFGQPKEMNADLSLTWFPGVAGIPYGTTTEDLDTLAWRSTGVYPVSEDWTLTYWAEWRQSTRQLTTFTPGDADEQDLVGDTTSRDYEKILSIGAGIVF